MNRLLAMVLASLLVGCAHTSVGVNSSGTAAGSTASVGAQVSAGAGGAAAVAMFAIAAVAIYGTTRPAPELDGSRRVNEQDCSKPIRDWSANLKCR